MKYGNFLVEIYEHANNHKQTTTASQKKYFYAPIALLDHKSAVSSYNNVTKQSEMRFRIEMWNEKVQNEVVKHLNKSIGQEIQSDNVRVIPLEKVILATKRATVDYMLSPEWTNYDKSKTLRLSLSCNDQKICDELASQMRSNPEQFDHLKLLYSLSSQTSQTKQTAISIDSVTSDHVQWDGEKFVPKPMQLSRINLGKFRDSQSFQNKNVRVRYTTAGLSAPIKFLEHTELTVTDEWNNLKGELEATTKLLRATVNNLVITRAELKNAKNDLTKTRIDFTNKLEGTKKELEKTKANVNSLSAQLNATSTGLETNLASTRTELGSTKSAVADLVTKVNARTSEIVNIGRMPTSCDDLQRTGHKLSGFFSVKGSKKMEMIYCNFNANQNDKQKWIGYADVKSAPVHFYVQRNSSFYNESTPIPFQIAVVNEGNAMDLTSGKFTAPRPGIYFFSFAGTARLESSSPASFYTRLYLNGKIIGGSHVDENKGPVDQYSPLTLQSTLNLKKGDQLWVQISFSGSSSYLYEANIFRMWNWVGNLNFNNNHFTHFTGIMLEEEIAASL
ncbi:hypothetical protein DAPPUDRAFT_240849 [Daphnia pulex]|uniref:C1q domain-containing protein n=1 Tax=Daphnia pulex TaxID=6669 RepID=E9GCR0_DAPPU|nr:hypothetical protein DAPPUDRAFT_240849 [Daphnia pulex]|eukprot:EFX82821.1 hypothetical protein DAPPUDRAFT_240849 [Daphnia pulex]